MIMDRARQLKLRSALLMSILSRRPKKRWLWLLIPVGVLGIICAIPLLLFGMLIGSRLLMIVAGPVNIWNTTWHIPSSTEVAGYYKVSKESTGLDPNSGYRISARSGFRLTPDHRVEVVIELPAFGLAGERLECNYNGTGTWSSFENSGVTIDLNIDVSSQTTLGASPNCGVTSPGLLQLLGHSPPYRIWYGIGDPDNGEGLTYSQQVL
jgi:hypothetical protein